MAGISVTCSACEKSLMVKDHLAGKRVRCPNCGEPFHVPQRTGAEDRQDQVAGGQRRKQSKTAPKSASPSAGERGAERSSALWIGLVATAAVIVATAIGGGLYVTGKLTGTPAAVGAAVAPPVAARGTPDDGGSASKQVQPSNNGESSRDPAPSPASEPAPANAPPGDVVAVAATDGAAASAAETSAPPATQVKTANAEPVAAATTGLPSDVVTFSPLETAESTSTMTLSEDGRQLFLAHEGASVVTVWDVAEKTAAASIPCDVPRALLSRGTMLYVANQGKGTISAFDGTKNWKRTRIVDVPHKGIVYLSAPAGRHFDGTIAVTCHGEGPEGSYRDAHIYLVDVNRGSNREGHSDAVATYSRDGKFIMGQGSFNLSPSGGIGVYPSATYAKPQARPTMQGGIQQTPYVYQAHEGSFWLATNMIFAAPKFALAHENVGRVIVPDLSQKVVYALTPETISARRLNATLSEIGSRPVKFPEDQTKDFSRLDHFVYRHREYRLDHPLAWSNGERLDVFLLDSGKGVVLHGDTRAFAASDEGAPAEMSLADGNSPAKELEQSEGPTKEIPAIVVEGERIERKLPNDSGKVTFSLLTGPLGMELSEDGRFTWQPTSDDVGKLTLRIEVAGESGTSVLEPQIVVVSKSLAASVDWDLNRLKSGTMDLSLELPTLIAGRDKSTMLLLQGDSLRILGADGLEVIETRTLPNRYQYLAERKNEYVGVVEGTQTLEVIDKKTLRVRKEVDLSSFGWRVMEVTDLAVHPLRDVSYVGIKHDVDVPRYLILQVDESTGKAAGEPLLGTWVEIDGTGKHLYAGYRDIYRNGTSFHLNPDWNLLAVPKYGNLDMLLAYGVQDARTEMVQIVNEAGGNGSGIRLSPDGRRVAYLSHVGLPLHSKKLPGFDTGELNSLPVSYAAGGEATPTDLAFHPSLALVATSTPQSVTLFNRETGEVLVHRLQMLDGGLGDLQIERVMFAPDGKSVLLLGTGGSSGRLLMRVGIDFVGIPELKPVPQVAPAAGDKSA